MAAPWDANPGWSAGATTAETSDLVVYGTPGDGKVPAWNATAGRLEWATPSGGGGGGASEQSPVVRKFTFAHGDAGLNNGIDVYTPTVGEILLNAWIQVDAAFDGTTPIADVGQFVSGGSNGWFSGGGSVPVGAGKADAGSLDATLLSGRSMSDLSLMLAFYNMLTSGQEAIDVDGTSIVADGATLILGGIRFLPAKFASTDPVKIVVSQDGTAGGAATGATAGAGTLYLVTAIPA